LKQKVVFIIIIVESTPDCWFAFAVGQSRFFYYFCTWKPCLQCC